MIEQKIKLSSQKELNLIKKLMKDNTEELGFLPMSRIEIKDSQGLLFHQYDNNEWLGYMVVGTIKKGWVTRIWQECIDKTARGYGSGKRLFEKLKLKCLENEVEIISLRCRESNEANMFWQAMGFKCVEILNTNSADKRLINVYKMNLEKEPDNAYNKIEIMPKIITTTTKAKYYN